MFAILLCHMTTWSLFNSFNEVAGKFMTFGSIFVCVSFVAFVNLRWDRLSFIESTLCEHRCVIGAGLQMGGGGGPSFYLKKPVLSFTSVGGSSNSTLQFYNY